MAVGSRTVADWRGGSVERGLVEAGYHPAGQWWVDLLERIEVERPRVVTIRAGRRAGKSTHSVRWALAEALTRQWRVDAGDQGIIAIVSARRWQAEDRIATVTKYVRALVPEGDILRANNQRVDFTCPWGICSIRSFTATLGDVVGGTVIAAILDEVARWIDDRGRNPATDVIASLKPSLLSTGGSMWLISSPWSTDDAHAKAFAQGDVDGQLTAHAATWEAASELYDESACRLLEPDDLIFAREYAAVPMATDGVHWLPGMAIDAAIGAPWRDGAEAMSMSAGGDLAFMRDAAALVVAGRVGVGRIGVQALGEWVPGKDGPLPPTATVAEAARLALTNGAPAVMTDSHARANMIEATRAIGIGYRVRPDNGEHWAYARKALLEGLLSLPHCESHCVCARRGICSRLVAQLRRVRVIPDGARLRVEHARVDGAHGDLAEAWACAIYQLRHGTSDDRLVGRPAVFAGSRARAAMRG